MSETKFKNNKFLFPTDEIKNFDGRNYQGLEIELKLGGINGSNHQYIQTKKTHNFPYEFGGRINKILEEPEAIVTRKINRIGLIESCNWWQRKRPLYNSYQEYFNQDKKRQLITSWRKVFANHKIIQSSLVSKLLGLKTSMNAQVLLEFADFKLETLFEHNFHYPEEWLSEFFCQFEFRDDCYTSAEKTICNLKPEKFSTTTVAILTIAKSLENAHKLRKISGALAKSPLIVHGEKLLMGVRYEDYPAVIFNIYELGGAVSKD